MKTSVSGGSRAFARQGGLALATMAWHQTTVKIGRTPTIIILAIAVSANLLGVFVLARAAMQTGEFTANLAISILLVMVLIPYLIMAVMGPRDPR
jgi:hypothetical protein